MRPEARNRWWRRGAEQPAEPLASFPAALVFTEVDDAGLRLDGLAGIPVPAGGPPVARALGRSAGAAAGCANTARHPFSLLVDAPAEGWLAPALVTLERWTDSTAALVVEVMRRGRLCQARISDGTAYALFDIRRSDGLFWLTIGP
ncbi:MAG TPA: hypothetical protein VFH50_12000 [Acidimicrobiales bacterium]|nr:hypothetical protein [Acidimicrobiales bacterium]